MHKQRREKSHSFLITYVSHSCLAFLPVCLLQTCALGSGMASGVFFLPNPFEAVFVIIKMDLGFLIAFVKNKLKGQPAS